MKYETIADIYAANLKIREIFVATVDNVSSDEATALPDGEKWTIEQVVEHVSIVEHNIVKICAKLIEASKVNGKPADGTLAVADDLAAKWSGARDVKLEAPERVQPTGGVPITGSIEQMNANRDAFDALRSDFESYDLSGSKFPHPFFGDLTATEWLILSGGHEARHTAQIGRILEKIRQ